MVKSLTAQRYVKSHKHKSDFYEKIAATQNWYVYILSKACIVYSHSVFRDGIGGRSEGREGLGSAVSSMLSAAFRGLGASLGLLLWGRYYIGGGLESRNRNEILNLPPGLFFAFFFVFALAFGVRFALFSGLKNTFQICDG